MGKRKSSKLDGLEELLRTSEDVEEFRGRMFEYLAERRMRTLPSGALRYAERGPCGVLLKELIPALRAHGYPECLDSISDAIHAVEFYEQARIYDPLGIALADAVFCAMRLASDAWDDGADAYLWRLCYRLACRAALDLDAKRDTDKQKTAKATAAKTAGGWEKQEAMSYVVRHARLDDGSLKSKARLSKEIYKHLWDLSQKGGRRFTRPMSGLDRDGYPIPTEAGLKTIQVWFKAQYDAQA